jgi:Domain of unknown function (DUF4149)
MLPILRFLMLLALVVWLGGIIFFSFGVAPVLFKVLPSRHLAGSIVTRSLAVLHLMGLISGVIFLCSSMAHAHLTRGSAEPLANRHVLVYVMILLTLISQFSISPKMAALRADMIEIDAIAPTDPRRIEFNHLHQWSTRLEGGVLLLGLAVAFLVARRLS